MTVLAPRLTDLDAKVLAVLDVGHGKRADRVADLVLGRAAYRCSDCGRITRVAGGGFGARGRQPWEDGRTFKCLSWVVGCSGREEPRLIAKPEQRREVAEILRGLETTGYASCRGGWWRRA